MRSAHGAASNEEQLRRIDGARGRRGKVRTALNGILLDNLLSAEQFQGAGRRVGLTSRELDVIRCAFNLESDAEIAMELRISTHTVHAHKANVFRKFGTSSMVRLLCAFIAISDDAASSQTKSIFTRDVDG